MSAEAVKQVFVDHPHHWTASTWSVAMTLADTVNTDHDNLCWRTVASIVRRCCVSDKGVRRALAQLEADGWITKVVQGSNDATKWRWNGPKQGGQGAYAWWPAGQGDQACLVKVTRGGGQGDQATIRKGTQDSNETGTQAAPRPQPALFVPEPAPTPETVRASLDAVRKLRASLPGQGDQAHA